MQTKIFIEKDAESLERVMNVWLAENDGNVDINAFEVSSSNIGVVVVIMYREI